MTVQKWQFPSGGTSYRFSRLMGLTMSVSDFVAYLKRIAELLKEEDIEGAKDVVREINETKKARMGLFVKLCV